MNGRISSPFVAELVAEGFYFSKWYNQIYESTKLKVKKFIKSGRLNFVNGGWVMHDEATTHFKHQLEQLRVGLEFLHKEFGIRPKVAWQLDPFGHSSANVIHNYIMI